MKHFYLLALLLLGFVLPVWSQTPEAPTSGTGTVNDPYLINTVGHLVWISALDSEVATPNRTARLSYHYKLTDNIAFPSDVNTWNSGAGFRPIGSMSYQTSANLAAFLGSFDGDFHEITGYVINLPSASGVGLFGVLGTNAVIKNLVVSGTVTGVNQVGGLVGYSFGGSLIQQACFRDGTITATGIRIGGLVGHANGSVERSFSCGFTINVSDGANGGLVGFLNFSEVPNSGSFNPTISDSYAIGVINQTNGTHANSTTGLVGYIGASTLTRLFSAVSGAIVSDATWGVQYISIPTVSNAYFDNSVKTSFRAGSIGLNSTQSKIQTNFANLDFTSVWGMNATLNDGYPFLQWQTFIAPQIGALTPAEGDGSSGNTYQIANFRNLVWMGASDADVASSSYADRMAAHYIQVQDIAFPAQYDTVNAGQGFLPIGDSTSRFSGSFDGQNHTITDLVINRASFLGLFGLTDNATLTQIKLVNPSLTGSGNIIGAIAGDARLSTITKVSSTGGSVSGLSSVGGLFGQLSGSTLDESFSTTAVNGVNTTGGLVGSLGSFGDQSKITNTVLNKSEPVDKLADKAYSC